MLKQVKHILFDIDDTIFPSSEFSSLARSNAVNAMLGMGMPGNYGMIMSKLASIIKARGSNYNAHFNELCRQLGVKNPGRYIAAAIAAYHDTKTSIQPFPKVPITLSRLKEKGYRIYVATKGHPVKQWDKLIRLRVALYFDGVFVSPESRNAKNAAFYRSISRKLRAKPGECMMVGDREDKDIKPAKKVGMLAVRVWKYQNLSKSKARKKSQVKSAADYVLSDISELVDIL